MTTIERLLDEHRVDVAEALKLGWGPWRLQEANYMLDAVHLRRPAGHRQDGSVGSWHIVACDERPDVLATNEVLSAADVGHLLNALRDCAYARAIGAGPWAKDGNVNTGKPECSKCDYFVVEGHWPSPRCKHSARPNAPAYPPIALCPLRLNAREGK